MHSSPRLEALEDRVVPALFGNPWADASTLKVSFLPDGTDVGTQDSALFAEMDDHMTEAVWQTEILRAIQTWAAAAQLNIRLESDSGDPVGTSGAVQNDFRFGDIRIGAISLGTEAVAVATPYDPSMGTWAGDILFNTDYAFSVGGSGGTYDLYSIALHEVGHALGLASNLTPGGESVMFDYYIGPRTILHGSDVNAIQKLYDTRDPDRFEGDLGNDTLATATPFTRAARQSYRQALRHLETTAEADAVERFNFDADLTTSSDVDWYRFKTSATNPGFTITLTTGVQSLLHGQLTVLDASGAVVSQQTMTSASTVFVEVPNAVAGARYYFRVEAAPGTAFSVGKYNLILSDVDASVLARLDGVYADFVADLAGHDNDTQADAEAMVRTSQNTGFRPVFTANGSLDATTDVDVYSLPALTNPGQLEVTLFLASPVGDPEDEAEVTVTLRDAAWNVVATRGVVNANGTVVLEANAPLTSQAYYLVVTTTAASAPGDYRLFAQFKLPSEVRTQVFSGTLGDGIPATPPEVELTEEDFQEELQAFRALTLATTQLLDLEFSNAGSDGTLLVEVYNNDDLDARVYWVLVDPGSTVRQLWLLGPGDYTFRFAAGIAYDEDDTGVGFAPLSFAVAMRVASDPIGPVLDNPANPPPRDLEPDTYDNDEAAVDPGIISILQLLDDAFSNPYGSYITKWY